MGSAATGPVVLLALLLFLLCFTSRGLELAWSSQALDGMLTLPVAASAHVPRPKQKPECLWFACSTPACLSIFVPVTEHPPLKILRLASLK